MKEKKTALPMERAREERSEEERRQRWMDGQIKQRQQPLNRGLTSHARRGREGEQVCFRGTEKGADKGRE